MRNKRRWTWVFVWMALTLSCEDAKNEERSSGAAGAGSSSDAPWVGQDPGASPGGATRPADVAAGPAPSSGMGVACISSTAKRFRRAIARARPPPSSLRWHARQHPPEVALKSWRGGWAEASLVTGHQRLACDGAGECRAGKRREETSMPGLVPAQGPCWSKALLSSSQLGRTCLARYHSRSNQSRPLTWDRQSKAWSFRTP